MLRLHLNVDAFGSATSLRHLPPRKNHKSRYDRDKKVHNHENDPLPKVRDERQNKSTSLHNFLRVRGIGGRENGREDPSRIREEKPRLDTRLLEEALRPEGTHHED